MDIFKWLKKGGYDYTWNVKLGGRTPDIVAFKEDEIVAFEIKKHAGELNTAIGQCLQYLGESNKVYIVLPHKEADMVLKNKSNALKKLGIGLISSNSSLKILIGAQSFRIPSAEKIISRLKKGVMVGAEQPSYGEDLRRKIISLLNDHPEGLSIQEISQRLKLHRHTVSKQILSLHGSNEIIVRKIGAANLIYVKGVQKIGVRA